MNEEVTRKLTTILYADVVDYSRLTGCDEIGTHRAVMDILDFTTKTIADAGGTVLRYAGDAVLAEFPSVVSCINAGIGIQSELAIRNQDIPEDEKTLIRMGINLGEVIEDRDEIYGDGVNLAARLETTAEPGGICISANVHDQIDGKIDISFSDSGEENFKNIAKPVRVYRWHPGKISNVTNLENTPQSSDRLSIAILPFDNMSGDPDQEYFSDGITEDIITELSRFREFHLIARNSSFFYKGQAVKVQDIGRDLGADYVVEGSVRKAGSRVRVTVQMVEATTGNHIWAERYDRTLDDIFAVQDELTHAIVSVLPIHLQSAVTESAYRKPTQSLTAYDYYLRGRWVFFQRGVEDQTAVAFLEKAIEIDPRFALAYAVLANTHSYSLFSLQPWDGDPEVQAKLNIKQALAFGENDPVVQAYAAEVYFSCGDFDLAKVHADLAIKLNPNDSYVISIYGFVLAYLGYAGEALRWIQKAVRAEVHPAGFLWEAVAEVQYMLRDYEAAIETFKRWRDPPLHTYTHLAACYAQLGLTEEMQYAIDEYNRRRSDGSNFPRYAAQHAKICKRQEDADHWLEGYRKAGLLD